MRRKVVVAALGCAAMGLFALPAMASARAHLVWAGGTPKFQKQIGKAFGAEALDFFPHSVTIHQGDTITWNGMSIGFHSIDVPKKGGADLPLILPTGTTASGLNDAAGNPFWFNGQPNVGFNPALSAASGGKSYDGSTRAESGLPLGKPKPYKLRFTKPGTYVYFCDVHYDMRGTIVVRPQSKKIPTPRQEASAIAAQQKRDTKIAKGLSKTKITGNRVSIGVGGKDRVEILGMFPKTLRVHTGATVSFAMPTRTGETHTASFGPASYLKPLSDSFAGPAPLATGVYPSSPPGAVIPVPGTHGNAFANTGALDRDSGSPLGPGARLTFTAPGTYHYECLIHPFMKGTVVVTG
jgi:plastocyanin